MKVFTGDGGPVKAVAFSPDGKYVRFGTPITPCGSGRGQRQGIGQVQPACRAGRQRDLRADGWSTLSGSSDSVIHVWSLAKVLGYGPKDPNPPRTTTTEPVPNTPAELKPQGTVPVSGTVSSLHLSPNGKWLYYLNATESKAGRVDTLTFRRYWELCWPRASRRW